MHKISLLCRRACLGMGFLSTVMMYSSNFLFTSSSWMTRWTLPYLTCTYLILLNSVTSCSWLPWISWYLLASPTQTWTHPTLWHNTWMDYHWMGESLHRIVWWICHKSSPWCQECWWHCIDKKSCGQISFTMDIWSNASLSLYLAVTSHWIAWDSNTNNNLSLKATLIGFHHFTGPHMGKSIASVILSLMDRTNITSKCHDLDTSGHGTCITTVCLLIITLSCVPFVSPLVMTTLWLSYLW